MSTPGTPQDNIRPLRREETPAEKLLPQNLEAEAAVLGSILIDGEGGGAAIGTVATLLSAADFYREAHREICSAAFAVFADGSAVDFITLTDELERRGRLEDVGGTAYVGSLANQVPSSHNVEYYARIVSRAAALRRLIATAGQIAAVAYSEPDANVALAEAERLLTAVRDQTRSSTPHRFGILSDLELEQVRPSKGILGSWIRDKEIVALYGASDSYKTFLAISMGACWATGLDWFGMPVEQRTVFYIAAEAPGTIGERLAAWKQHHGLAGQRTEFYTSTLPVDLTSMEEVTALIGEIRDCLPDAPGAIIIDTYACATSGDEKDAASVNAAYRGMRLLRDAFDATIVYVDHEGKDRERGQTGSQRKKDNSDAQIHVERIEGQDGMITVTPRKIKMAERPSPLTLQTKHVGFYGLREQEMSNSLVLIGTSKAEAQAVSKEARAQRLSRRQRQALDTLTDLAGGTASYGDWWRACHKGDPKTFPKSTFDDCRDALVKARLVSVSETNYVSLVRSENRTSTAAPSVLVRFGTVPYIGDRTTIPDRTSDGGVVPTVPDVSHDDTLGHGVERGQTARYHRHDPKTMKIQRDGVTICDACHPRPQRE